MNKNDISNVTDFIYWKETTQKTHVRFPSDSVHMSPYHSFFQHCHNKISLVNEVLTVYFLLFKPLYTKFCTKFYLVFGFTYRMKPLLLERYDKSRCNHSAPSNILYLVDYLSHIYCTISKYQHDILAFTYTAFIYNGVQWHCQRFCENICTLIMYNKTQLLVRTTFEMLNVSL